MAKLKVFAIGTGQSDRSIVAASSRKTAALLVGCSYHYMAGYGSVTGNVEECAVALSQPGTVFVRGQDDRGPWKVAESRMPPPRREPGTTPPEIVAEALNYMKHHERCSHRMPVASNFQKPKCNCGKEAAVDALVQLGKKACR